ncbi:formimidoylglutamase [Aestuariibacter salexigens]|uniref:formimidoylglutamase n=1 Tax=Aestuariibacter salexigens TaxID=226010 RepID=UPI0004210EFA|nr:formimidoylglutamase [Aestuariibacter salexigens]
MSLVRTFPWQGRTDSEDGTSGTRWHQHITRADSDKAQATLLGFACDLGVANNKGRTGAKQGPNAIRQALCNLAWHTDTTLTDSGDIVAQYDLAQAQQGFAQAVSEQLAQQRFVIGLGGGHEIAWASYQGIEKIDKGRIGIINIDAHFDLRTPAPNTSSGTPFYQIAQHCEAERQSFHYTCLGIAKTANTQALFARAEQTGTRYVLDTECTFSRMSETVLAMLDEVDTLYLTICLDAFNAAVAPGVSAPSALGVDVSDIIQLVRWVGEQVRQRGIAWPLADIAEMNPAFDQDQRTAKLAARLIFELLEARFSGAT